MRGVGYVLCLKSRIRSGWWGWRYAKYLYKSPTGRLRSSLLSFRRGRSSFREDTAQSWLLYKEEEAVVTTGKGAKVLAIFLFGILTRRTLIRLALLKRVFLS